MAASVWPDGSVAVAVALVNPGDQAASGVKVSSVSLGSGTLVSDPAPLNVGSVAAGQRAVMQLRFGSVKVPGTYTITMSGQFSDSSRTTKPFQLTGTLEVSNALNGSGISGNGVLVPHQTLGKPIPGVQVSDVEIEGVEEAGPPIPDGPGLLGFAPTASTAVPQPMQISEEPPAAHGPAVAGRQAGKVIQNTLLPTANLDGWPPDPSVAEAVSSKLVIATANTHIWYSTNDGASFNAPIETNTIFSTPSGTTVICDQVVTYNAANDLFILVIQYSGGSNPALSRERIAVNTSANLKNNIRSWTYYDFQPANLSTTWWFDCPDLSWTNSNLYMSWDEIGGGMAVTRVSLAQLAKRGSVNYSYFSDNQSSQMNNCYACRLCEGSPSGMYWAGRPSNSSIEVFSWPDSSNSVSWVTSSTNTFLTTSAANASNDPDGKEWIDNSRPAGTGAITAAAYMSGDKQLWFGFDAGRDVNHPQPFIAAVEINNSNLKYAGLLQIGNSTGAWAYPAFYPAPGGTSCGVAVSFGGPSFWAASTYGILPANSYWYPDQSQVTVQGSNFSSSGGVGTRYGDMFSVRPSGSGSPYISTLTYVWRYSNLSTKANLNYYYHYIQYIP
jgi:hypothetical protein